MIDILCETDEDGLYLIFQDFDIKGNVVSLLFSMDFNGVLPYWRGSECEDVRVDGVDEI